MPFTFHHASIPAFAAAKVRFCGYIARQPGRQSRAAVRRGFGLAEHEPMLLVTTGGGEDGHSLISTCLQALQSLPDASRPRTHIVCGPEMGDAQRQAIKQAANAMPEVSLQDFSDDMMSLIDAADVVVAMGGYNTVCEVLTLGKRAVVVPRVKPGKEQYIHAQRMAALGLLRMLPPDQMTPGTLLQAVQSELASLARRDPLPQLRVVRSVACRCAPERDHATRAPGCGARRRGAR